MHTPATLMSGTIGRGSHVEVKEGMESVGHVSDESA